MKKNILTMAALMAFAGMQAQIQTNNGTVNGITNSNVLLDGSSAFSTEAGAPANIGKGLIIPSVDLVNFEFDLTLADGFTFPTYFDGMIVYNNATGNTLTTGNRPSSSLAVTPGYYYFSNPNGASNGNVTGGQWKALGGTASGGDNLGDHSATKTLALNGFDLRLKGASDGNQALAYNPTIDGPRLWGNAGGALGTVNGTNALSWDNNGSINILKHIVAGGSITTGNNNWFNVPGSGSGIYWQQHGGGWYMNDNDFIRAFNDKNIITGGSINAGTTLSAGTHITAGGSITAGDGNWFNVRGSGSGIYWQQLGGGWYMNDTDWMRVFNDKGIFTGGKIETGGSITAGTNRWFNVQGTGTGIYWTQHGGGWYMNDNTWIRAFNDKSIFTNGNIASGADVSASSDLIAGQHIKAGGSITTGNNNWFNVPGSGSGIYWQQLGGGWFMNDTTWMRVFNNKSIYTGGNLQIVGTGVFGGTVTTPRVQGPSDRRFKKDITPIYNATEKLNQLNGYTYTWKDKKEFPGQTLGEGKDMGVIAQEVEKVFPDAVMTNKDGYKSVNYNALIPVLIEALKESNKKIQALEDRLNGASAPAETSARLDRKADGITASATPMKIN